MVRHARRDRVHDRHLRSASELERRPAVDSWAACRVCDATRRSERAAYRHRWRGRRDRHLNGTRGLTRRRVRQQVNGAGARQWLLSGLPICARTGGQQRPGDHPGRLGWRDHRLARRPQQSLQHRHLRAARERGRHGALARGRPRICTASADQIGPALTTDQLGGAYSGVRTAAGTSGDAYAQRVTATGNGHAHGRRPGRRRPAVPARAAASQPDRAGSALALTLPVPRRSERRGLRSLGPPRAHATAERELEAGDHEIAWDGRDDLGAPSPGGVFFVEVRAGSEVSRQKIVRLRCSGFVAGAGRACA